MELLARLANLPGALPGACAQGLIWGIMAIGVYLTYRILDVADLTVDQLKKMFTGEITNWKDEGGDDSEIVLVGHEASSGPHDF